jgi:LacI family transcriptional regulator
VAVTRDDVARAAGVSTAVVSYVLNDGPRPVSAEARQRVLAAIGLAGDPPAVAHQGGRVRRHLPARPHPAVGPDDVT